MKNSRENKPKPRRGRPPKHGGYSLSFSRDEQLKRDYPLVRRYLEGCRAGLVRDVGGSEEGLTEQQRILIDRVVSRLAVCRLIEIYVERFGAFRRDKLKRKVLELEPCLGKNYLSFTAAIDRALIALGLERKKHDVIDLGKYIDDKKREKAEKSVVDGPAPAEIAPYKSMSLDVSGKDDAAALDQGQNDSSNGKDGQGIAVPEQSLSEIEGE